MLDNSIGPYLTVVKGSTENATYYSQLLGHSTLPTPLWNKEMIPFVPVLTHPIEQAISISIDNTSIFIPGGSPPQNGFRRTGFIAQIDGNHTYLNGIMEVGTTVFHVSIKGNTLFPLNYTHEYQIVWIEPNDGSHVFEIQVGSPFTDPTGPLPAPKAHYLKVRDHALNLLFYTPFTMENWHNFAVQINWESRTLGVYYSTDDAPLQAVTGVLSNPTTSAGATGQGDYHFGVLKLPLVNPADTPAEQANVVDYGIQEGDKETLLYSGVFVEHITRGVSAGNGRMISPIS
ncbi:hypothetical protein SERLA73DRAFT_175930 [Serpula lacrymans var. lacrymans S7.3]|uniref:Glycoside hydrolase 131 catalytic N-terminal domain-containing protein n=2 Tax=Serpula lacrymans var. lacrymans TaxID=341189 RepID=F8PK07_SERL3|nr:uncharacterized protein SERLADRAFT_458588 [Serpula lacrymans var. lacrymans S7.9]EGO04144.1 hypothetical protein SERLA73DRAFT_175930 [Serpula lacrymans var. lacrymans S7.3]EGO30075.1 hypothetical protein SERLADRAFT_458588 [Serpula lacrymans var. lacrymans S7.9]